MGIYNKLCLKSTPHEEILGFFTQKAVGVPLAGVRGGPSLGSQHRSGEHTSHGLKLH